MHGLTSQQHAIVGFIEEYTHINGCAPSYREIGSHFGLSSLGSVYKHIQTLLVKGALTSLPGQSRSLAVTEAVAPVCMIPLVGYLRGGSPIEMVQNPQQIALPSSMVNDNQLTYLLRVDDDTLSEELIAKGDLLIVEIRPPNDDGEVIIGIVNGQEILVKKYYRVDSHVRLEGQHARHMPMIFKAEYVEVLGVLRGVLRI